MSDENFKNIKDICISKKLLKKWEITLQDQESMKDDGSEFIRFPDARLVYKENISK